MAVLKINHTSNLVNNHSQRLISFGDESLKTHKENSAVQNGQNFRRLSDDELRFFSSLEPDRRFFNVSKNVMKTLLIAVPAIDIAVSALSRPGNLSSKIFGGIKSTAMWAGAFVAGTAVSGVKKSVNSRSEFFDNFDKKHAFAGTAIDFAAIYGAFALILNTANVLKNTLTSKFPTISAKIRSGVKEPVKNLLNKSLLNKKVVIPVENYLSKKPNIAKTNKLFASLLVPAIFSGVVLRYIHEAKRHDKACSDNYRFLKNVNELLPHDNKESGEI